MQISVNSPNDVANLPWAGDFDADAPLAELVNQYIMREPALANRQRADELANWHMCGERVELVGTQLDPRDWCSG